MALNTETGAPTQSDPPQAIQDVAAAAGSKLRYVRVLGSGRSGTTWLGRILAVYSGCLFKHEPVLRFEMPYRQWYVSTENDDLVTARQKLDALVMTPIPQIDTPPYLPRQFPRATGQIPRALHWLAKKTPLANPLFRYWLRPGAKAGFDVLMKDVNHPLVLLERMHQVMDSKMVVIIRNPFGTIASVFKRLESGKAAPVNMDIVRRNATTDAKALGALDLVDGIEKLSSAGVQALLWRLHNERLLRLTQSAVCSDGSPAARLVVYEDICDDPMNQTRELLDFIGWPHEKEIFEFLEATTSGPRPGEMEHRKRYTVYRDPSESRNKWRKALSEQQKADVHAVVDDSPLCQFWPDIFDTDPHAVPDFGPALVKPRVSADTEANGD